MRGVQPSQRRQLLVVAARGGFYFFGSWMGHGHISRRPFVQQQFGGLHHGVGVEARTHPAVEQHIGGRCDGHSLVVRHEGLDDDDIGSFRQSGTCVVECFVESVRAQCAYSGKVRVVLHRRLRVDHGCQTRCIRGDDQILAQATLEPEARHAEVGILIGELQIARAIGRFGNSPRNVQRCAVADLPAHDEAAGLLRAGCLPVRA